MSIADYMVAGTVAFGIAGLAFGFIATIYIALK